MSAEQDDTDRVIFAFRRNVVVAASAGTGKTHRLTALYLLLTLGLTSMGEADDRAPAPPLAPDRIVATTFSRAAATEIAVRVERALRAVASLEGFASSKLAPAITARLDALGGAVSHAELRRRAEGALARWQGAKIDTLHGLARKIVQRNALALGLPPSLDVLDEEDARALADLAVDEALGAALTKGGEGAEVARALLTSAGGVGATRFQIQRLLDRLDEEGVTPPALALADHMAEARALASRVRRVARDLAAEGHASLREPAALLHRTLLNTEELLPERSIPALVELANKRLPPRGKRGAADDALDELIQELPGKNKQERALSLAAMLRAAPDLGRREEAMIALIEDARARLASAKRRAGGLGFGDLLRIARDALRDRPEIARSVREETSALLVDELQDTSRVQRDLVFLLRERDDAAAARAPLAAPDAHGLTGHGLFLVGDRKQSIYGFRGADVAVFARMAADLAGRAAGEALALPLSLHERSYDAEREPLADFVALRESRRSGPAILSFVNAFSSRDFVEGRDPSVPPRDFEITYGPAEHLVSAFADDGDDRSAVIVVPDDGASPDDTDPLVRESSGAAREAHVAAAFVARVTRREAARDGGPDLPLDVTRFRDVAILARRRSTIPLVEIALARLGLPYVVAGRALYDAVEVRDVAALLRLLLDPRDRLALATVLRGPMVALSDTSLTALSPPGKGITLPLLGRQIAGGEIDLGLIPPAERARLTAFRARFVEVRRAALRSPPGEAIRSAISVFDYDRVLAALPRAEARIGNLDRLVSIARRRGGTLASFVRWLERRIRDETDEAEAAVFSAEDDAIRLTTIHASKGLDFPVVVLVDANAEPRAEHGGVGLASFDRRAGAPTFIVRHYAPRLGGRDGGLVAIATGAQREAYAEARARELAERKRLFYVAITRAQKTLAIVCSASPPRGGSAQKTLALGLEQGDVARAVTRVVPALELLAEAEPLPEAPRPPDLEMPSYLRRPARSPARVIALDAEALALFEGCPRRYELRRLVGIEEPVRAGQLDLFTGEEVMELPDPPPPITADPFERPQPRSRALHRALARLPLASFGAPVDHHHERVEAALAAEGLTENDAEGSRLARGIEAFFGGAYARSAREGGASVRRDTAFSAVIARGARGSVEVSGEIDLTVRWEDGRAHLLVIRPIPARADLSRYEALLRAAAFTERDREESREIHAGVVFLSVAEGGAEPSPVWLGGGAITDDDHDRFAKRAQRAGERFAEARWSGRFEPVAPSVCERLRCGFFQACHGR